MANHVSHAALPFPVKGARFTIDVPYLDADGDPTDPTTPDTEVSKDGAAFSDCAEEVTTISGSNGFGYLTLTGAEMDCSLVVVAAKVASGPKATLLSVRPRVLPIVHSGTAQSGASGSITLAAGAPGFDISGCIVRTTGGTGGGGTGGANNQARVVTAYNTSTRVATVVPNWETAPAGDTTYEILLTDLAVNTAGIPQTGDAYAIVTSGTHGNAALKTLIDALDDYVDTEVAAIKAKTDTIPAAPAATGDAMTLTSGERTSIAAALLDLTDGVEASETVRQCLRLMRAALVGKSDGFPAGPVHFRDRADSKNRITATVDADGNRTAVSTDAT